MADKLTVSIVTPDGVVYERRAKLVVAKTTNGALGILPKHAPIIVPLEIEEVCIERESKDETDYIAVNGGILEVRDNVVSIIADSAERQGDIDVKRAQLARQKAEKLIKKAQEEHNTDEVKRATVALHRALNRIHVSQHH